MSTSRRTGERHRGTRFVALPVMVAVAELIVHLQLRPKVKTSRRAGQPAAGRAEVPYRHRLGDAPAQLGASGTGTYGLDLYKNQTPIALRDWFRSSIKECPSRLPHSFAAQPSSKRGPCRMRLCPGLLFRPAAIVTWQTSAMMLRQPRNILPQNSITSIRVQSVSGQACSTGTLGGPQTI